MINQAGSARRDAGTREPPAGQPGVARLAEPGVRWLAMSYARCGSLSGGTGARRYARVC
jgi:hypothetical protein